MRRFLLLVTVMLSAMSVSVAMADDPATKAQNLCQLGEYYFNKENRTEADIDNAIKCWAKAAELGSEQAMELLRKNGDYIKNEVIDMDDNTARGVTNTEEEIHEAVDVLPEFPGGMAAMMSWLGQNIVYPEEALKNNIQGRVLIKFVVEKDGSIGECTIVRGVDKMLDEESLRVVSAMPKWKPGMNNGEVVRCFFTLPITFKL